MVCFLSLLKTALLKIIWLVPQLIGNLIFIHIPTTSKLFFSSQYMELEVMKTCWRGSILVWNCQLVLFIFKPAKNPEPNYGFVGNKLRISEEKCIWWNQNWQIHCKQYLRKRTQENKLSELYFCYKLSQSQLI